MDADSGSDANNGLSQSKAFATIQKAIDKAAAGSTILVAPGDYAPFSSENKKLAIKATEGAGSTTVFGGNDRSSMGANLGKRVWKKNGWKTTNGWVYTGNATTLEVFTVRGCGSAVMGGRFMHGVIAENVPAGSNTFCVVYFSTVSDSRIERNGDTATHGDYRLAPSSACADFDGDGAADFGVYAINTKDPCFLRLFSSSRFRETRTLPMGSKGDVPVVGVYESGQPAAPAVWTGTKWTYLDSSFDDVDLVLE